MMLSISEIKRCALEVGFDGCGVAKADALTDEEYPLRRWLERGYHADLRYMERNVDKRLDPRLLLPGAKSVVCVVRGYNPSRLMNGHKKIARYAYGEDYHDNIRRDLHRLKSLLGLDDAKVCCDTVPISDKHWAAKAGLGWIGRHTLLVTPEWGSWVNLGELVTTIECDQYDTPIESKCTDCNLCVNACPNKALEPYGPPMMNVAKCTAYQTIESKSNDLPADLERQDYVFGCDVCQLACPYNAQVKTKHMDDERIRQLERLPEAMESDFNDAVTGTAMSRITYKQWRRNTM